MGGNVVLSVSTKQTNWKPSSFFSWDPPVILNYVTRNSQLTSWRTVGAVPMRPHPFSPFPPFLTAAKAQFCALFKEIGCGGRKTHCTGEWIHLSPWPLTSREPRNCSVIASLQWCHWSTFYDTVWCLLKFPTTSAPLLWSLLFIALIVSYMFWHD